MATLASLVVSLEANVARFESDLNKAEFMAKKAMDTISNVSETAMNAVKGAVMAMAAAYTFDAFAEGRIGRHKTTRHRLEEVSFGFAEGPRLRQFLFMQAIHEGHGLSGTRRRRLGFGSGCRG